ncbi:MAG: flagellar hook-associated protein FlgK, partial [Planctomycetales bacterium]|nr:flagellar hook-associated protein FlgK [Planctomycetales bacterium]
MFNVSSALSALRANQMALTVIGNNIANATTPDYHRQSLRLVDARPINLVGYQVGQGVEISSIHRAYSSITEAALTRNVSEQAAVSAQMQVAREIESMFTPGQGTILDRLETFYNDLQSVTQDPDNSATRTVVLRSAQNLTDEINAVGSKLDQMLARLDRAIDDKLEFIHNKTSELVDLNLKIREALIRKESPNDLMDRRDQLVNELAKEIDVRVDQQATTTDDISIPETVLRMADGQVQLLRFPLDFSASTDPTTGERILYRKGSIHPTPVTQGELGGLLTARNHLITQYRERLDEFTAGLVTAVDKVHINGVGLTGSFDVLRGIRRIEPSDIPLARTDTIVPIQSGSLFISVIDPSGSRTVEQVDIDADVDTLQDVVTRISDLDHLEARLDDPPGQLSIRAETGYQFDFVTVAPTLLNTDLITGTAVPTISGEYEGVEDDAYVFEFDNNGEIGVTDDLRMTVRDSLGAIVGSFNVGRGYEAGQPILIGAGISLAMSPGVVNSGDQFSTKLIHEADSTNLLVAAGLNTLFKGSSALSLGVRDELLETPELFAATRSGDPLDTRNIEAMINTRYKQFLGGGTQTL